MNAVCRERRERREIRPTRRHEQPREPHDKTLADELFVEGRESDNGPPLLKTYLGARRLELNSLIWPPWSQAHRRTRAANQARFV